MEQITEMPENQQPRAEAGLRIGTQAFARQGTFKIQLPESSNLGHFANSSQSINKLFQQGTLRGIQEANRKRANRFSAANSDASSNTLQEEECCAKSHASFDSDSDSDGDAKLKPQRAISMADPSYALKAVTERLNRLEFKCNHFETDFDARFKKMNAQQFKDSVELAKRIDIQAKMLEFTGLMKPQADREQFELQVRELVIGLIEPLQKEMERVKTLAETHAAASRK